MRDDFRLMQIVTPRGEIKTIQIWRFNALDGWNLQSRFRAFAASRDSKDRKQYVMDVLKYAKVIIQDRELPLSTSALLDNHLGSAENIKDVFEAILMLNEIDPESHGREVPFWESAGEELATAFVATFYRLDLTGAIRGIRKEHLIKLAKEDDRPNL